jgi:hypothetical protein
VDQTRTVLSYHPQLTQHGAHSQLPTHVAVLQYDTYKDVSTIQTLQYPSMIGALPMVTVLQQYASRNGSGMLLHVHGCLGKPSSCWAVCVTCKEVLRHTLAAPCTMSLAVDRWPAVV